MNPKQLLQILRLRWMLVLVCVIMVGSGATLYTLRLPKIYTSQTSLLLDVKADPLVATFMPNITTPAFFATQSHIIKSDKVAAAVVKRLGLETSREAVARWKSDTQGKVPLATYYANMMQRGLAVEPAPGTNVLNISFSAADPRFASMVANAYAQAYIDFSVDLRVEPAKNYAAWFDGQLKQLRSELEQAQARLSEAQQQRGIISADSRLDDEVTKLNSLMAQLANTQLERTENSIMARNSGSETSPDIQSNSQIQVLKQQLAKLDADFSEVKTKFGEQHPQHQLLQNQIRTIEGQLAAEMRKVAAASSTLSRVSSQKVAELTAQIEAQKAKVLSLRGGRDDLGVLVKDVETAQRAYESVSNRRAQLLLESQSDQAAARVLSVAVEALAPSSKAPVHILMGILGGMGLGCALAIALELMDRRIRSSDDLLDIEGVPVLAILNDKPTALPMSLTPKKLGQSALKLLGSKGS
jgi:chain length determinant protein EpsF